VRKEVRVQGKSVLVFWYRNQIYAIEARCGPSPPLPAPPSVSPPPCAPQRPLLTPPPPLRRSPAEGAYSEGFIRSKFTQDFCIECPTTGSLFSLKDGSVVTWYPNNFVLRALTPVSTCRNLEIYPVKLTQDAIGVDVSGGALQAGSANVTKGGSDTSLENNNVYGLEPKVYVEAGGAEVGGEPAVAKVATGVVFALAVTSVVVVALAVVKYVTS
jgi:nitrite reductase/ring-hydroxylating ferredoxin subunit